MKSLAPVLALATLALASLASAQHNHNAPRHTRLHRSLSPAKNVPVEQVQEVVPAAEPKLRRRCRTRPSNGTEPSAASLAAASPSSTVLSSVSLASPSTVVVLPSISSVSQLSTSPVVFSTSSVASVVPSVLSSVLSSALPASLPVEVSTSVQTSTPAASPFSSAAQTTSVVIVPPPPSTIPAPSPTSSPVATPSAPAPAPPSSGHPFTLTNKCSTPVQPAVADTMCGYSPRCSGASAYSGTQPGLLAPGASQTIVVNDNWVGRVFVQNGNCGAKGEDCSMAEFNLDTGSQWTPQAYDISNIQGFTQAMSVGAAGCDTATCTNENCGCTNAYAIGDLTGCGADLPVKACGAGNISFDIMFCP